MLHSNQLDAVTGTAQGGMIMRDNVMFIPAIILMVVEVKALVFLIWSWCDAKRRNRDA